MSPPTNIEIVFIAIIILALVISIAIPYIRKRTQDAKLKRLKIDPSEHIERLLELEATMDRLYSENQVIESLDKVFEKIPKYVNCANKEEDEYCRMYLRKKYSGAYRRYDDERLR